MVFKWLHPDIAMKIAIYFSTKNKMISGVEDMKFLGEDKEFLIIYSKEKLKSENLRLLRLWSSSFAYDYRFES